MNLYVSIACIDLRVITMNLLDKLYSELNNKHLNDFEKVRYLYLRTCELFSFDSRYSFTNLFSDQKLYLEIVNRKIDLTNVEDFLVVCHSYSREVLFKLIRELTSASVQLNGDKQHSFVVYEEKPGVVWDLDATFGDFPRAKIGVQTNGFYCSMSSYKERIDETDHLLGYVYKTKSDYLKLIDLSSNENMFKSISLLLANSKCKKEFSDAIYFIRWLLLGVNYQFSDSTYMNEDYDFHHILDSSDNEYFCCLSKINDNYEFEQISKNECLRLTRSFKSSADGIIAK